MGKKKQFIDKKKSATFQLRSRDTSGGEDLANSIFADAPDDIDGEKDGIFGGTGAVGGGASRGALPDQVRSEIIELGLPDDGYNYLLHVREIKNTGGGSVYYHNSKAKLDLLPPDVKAYDASGLRISTDVSRELNNSFYGVASKTVGVKLHRALDPDVAMLLDDTDLSRFGSDVEDLDEDFVVKANLPDTEEEDELVVKDEFDLLTCREYDDDDGDESGACMGTDDEPPAAKISDALKPYGDSLELDHKYRVPGDLEHGHLGSDAGEEDLSTDVIQKRVEYAEKYDNESDDDKDDVLVEESSDESEVWDCETIVSTYSNLDNHPGKILAPGNPKNRMTKNFPGDSILRDNVIALRGKEKLPVQFLPQSKRAVEKVKAAVRTSSTHMQNGRPHGEESKEEKKERKAALKEKRREARRAKKELKGLYKCEAHKAQKVAAVAGPSSVRLM